MKEQDIHILLDEIVSGHSRSFERLVDQYKGMVFGLCLKMLKDHELAEEVAQDSFVKAYQSLNKFKRKSKFSTWLYQITYYTAITALRKNKQESSIEIDVLPLESEDTADEIVNLEDKQHLLSMAIKQLSGKEAAVIELYYLQELEIKEIAMITKQSVSNIKVRIHRSRKKLYHILSEIEKKEQIQIENV